MLHWKRISILAFVLVTAAATRPFLHCGAQTSSPGPGTGALYSANCVSCHGLHENIPSQAPDRNALSQMTPERIYRALTDASIAAHANVLQLKVEQRKDIAEFLAGRPVESGPGNEASAMKNQCRGKPLGDPFTGPEWNGWGTDLTNARFQPANAAGLTAAQVSHLQFKWAFAFPNANSAWSHPVVFGGRIYVGSSNGSV